MTDASKLAFLDQDMKWLIEKGEYTLMIRSSSEDIRLATSFERIKNSHIDGKERTYYSQIRELIN